MFDRKTYKILAQEQLDSKWKVALLVAFTNVIISSLISFFSELSLNSEHMVYISLFLIPIWMILTGTLLIAVSHFFIQLVKNKKTTTYNTFLEGFALWGKGTLALLWEGLWIFLWTLLFFIPGIVKAFSYSQMLFILAENPKIGVKKSMKLSIAITKGYKGELFFLGFSFIGWYLLASAPNFIISFFTTGSFFSEQGLQNPWGVYLSAFLSSLILPYVYTTFIYAYRYLKQIAIDKKVVSHEDFGEEKNIPETEQIEQ